jgi:hypothetical protein
VPMRMRPPLLNTRPPACVASSTAACV